MEIQRETEALGKVPLFSKREQSKLELLAITSAPRSVIIRARRRLMMLGISADTVL